MKLTSIAVCLAFLFCASSVSGQNTDLDYVKYKYTLLQNVTSATTCVKNTPANTPATCPASAGVPQTKDGKDGSTVCVTAYVGGKSYEAVFSLSYPAFGAVPGCTTDAQCAPDGTTALPGIICATNALAGVGIPNTCFPLAPAACPFTGDSVTKPTTATATAGRKLAF